MMSVYIKPEQQIQRINQLLGKLEAYKGHETDLLRQRPHEKAWSVFEVMKHMSVAHLVYRPKVEGKLELPAKQKAPVENLKSGAIVAFLLKRFPPAEGKIRFKMKTAKKFYPMLDNASIGDVEGQAVLSELEECLLELKSWVNHYRTKSVSLKKFNSAVGPVVRFNIPEACEFILCHNERHFQQAENTLKKVSKQVPAGVG